MATSMSVRTGARLPNSAFVTVAAAPGQKPVLTSLFLCATNMWAFNGLKVQSLQPAALGNLALVEVKDGGASYPTSNIVFENMTISSPDDVSNWTQAQWVANGRQGFIALSSAGGNNTKCISMTGSHISNVRFGASLGANFTVFSGNEIDHFDDDGVDFAASGLSITKNYIHDSLGIGDGNHPDAMQGEIGVQVAGVASNNYGSITIDSNRIIRQTDPKSTSSRSACKASAPSIRTGATSASPIISSSRARAGGSASQASTGV